jgi:hypothetical protein
MTIDHKISRTRHFARLEVVRRTLTRMFATVK